MDPFGVSDPYLSGLQPAVPTVVVPISPTSSAVTGPKFTTLLLALAGLGVITWLVGPDLGVWVPIIALGGYAAVQSGFVNGLLGKFNQAVGA